MQARRSIRVCSRDKVVSVRARFVPVVSAALLVVACDEPRVRSEGGGFDLQFAGLRTEALIEWEAPYRVVVGTRLCPQVRCAACDADDSCAAVSVTASGAVHAEDGCFVADAPGPSEWRVGAPCDDPEAPRDRAAIEVVAAEETAAELVLWPERAFAAAGSLTLGAPPVAELPAPLRVIAGSQLRLDVRLYTPADGHVVAWSDGEVALQTTAGRAPVVYPGERLELVSFPETAAAASFRVGEFTWPIGQVVGVPEDAARSLELAVALLREQDGATPAIVRAQVRDAQGRILLGMPVTWSVESGELALAVDTSLPGPDYVKIEDHCLPPEARGGPRTAEIRAEAGELTGHLLLRWPGVAGAADPTWTPGERCPEAGCGCRSQPGGAAALLLLLLRRRRGGAR